MDGKPLRLCGSADPAEPLKRARHRSPGLPAQRQPMSLNGVSRGRSSVRHREAWFASWMRAGHRCGRRPRVAQVRHRYRNGAPSTSSSSRATVHWKLDNRIFNEIRWSLLSALPASTFSRDIASSGPCEGKLCSGTRGRAGLTAVSWFHSIISERQ